MTLGALQVINGGVFTMGSRTLVASQTVIFLISITEITLFVGSDGKRGQPGGCTHLAGSRWMAFAAGLGKPSWVMGGLGVVPDKDVVARMAIMASGKRRIRLGGLGISFLAVKIFLFMAGLAGNGSGTFVEPMIFIQHPCVTVHTGDVLPMNRRFKFFHRDMASAFFTTGMVAFNAFILGVDAFGVRLGVSLGCR